MVAPAATDWTATEIITWLAQLGIGPGLTVDLARMCEGPFIPDNPDRVAVITPTVGPGETLDGVGDITGFQLLIRGDQRGPSSAVRLAQRADRLIRFAPFPMDVNSGGLRLARVMRAGSGPAVLGQDDDADRVTCVCTYLTEVLQ